MLPQLTEQDIYTLSTIQLLPLGTVFFLPTVNGKKGFRYVKVGGTSAIAAGKLLVAAAAPANSTGLALPTTNSVAQLSAGSRQILVTNGGTAVTQDQFAGGQVEFLGTNLSGPCVIAGNTADSTGTGTITLSLLEPLTNTTAMVNATNTVNLRQSSAYLPVASTTQSNPVGVTIMPIANSATVTYFAWVQISGPGFVFATTATKGYPLVQDTSGTAGYVANTASNLPQIGICQESVASNMASINLMLN